MKSSPFFARPTAWPSTGLAIASQAPQKPERIIETALIAGIIEEQLLAEFREEVLVDRVKQMVGRMVRQILEQQGGVLDQADVKVQSVPFSETARYRRPDGVTFHAFRNTGDPRDVAITDRRQNAPLPPDARWAYYTTFASPLRAAVAFGVRKSIPTYRPTSRQRCRRWRTVEGRF